MSPYEAYFRPHSYLRAVIETVLQGHGGKLTCQGQAVRLDLGCYAILGGDAESEGAANLIESVPVGIEMYCPDKSWRKRIDHVLDGEVEDASMNGYLPGGECASHAQALAARVPTGYALLALNETWASQIDATLSPNGLCIFGSSKALLNNSFAFIAVKNGQLSCLASAYSCSSSKVEVAIATAPAHRNQGLAGCVAGAMVSACFQRGLEPHWHASNPVSQRLAQRLGFRLVGRCEILKPLARS